MKDTEEEETGHAPRERVSWNEIYFIILSCDLVTLHVSVWVEIPSLIHLLKCSRVTLHVSVWVEMWASAYLSMVMMSRSTWACELKFSVFLPSTLYHHVTLHVSVWVEMTRNLSGSQQQASRSTWACELKYKVHSHMKQRENVTLHVSVWVEITLTFLSSAEN